MGDLQLPFEQLHYALLQHESDPAPIDEAMRANGGIVYRRSIEPSGA